MRLKQWLAVFLVVVMVTTTTAWAAPAQEEYVCLLYTSDAADEL